MKCLACGVRIYPSALPHFLCPRCFVSSKESLAERVEKRTRTLTLRKVYRILREYRHKPAAALISVLKLRFKETAK
jgi:predicted RNA-binding Zn-ribbon protein involved in translation (DUF1610 family)